VRVQAVLMHYRLFGSRDNIRAVANPIVARLSDL
jgi:hypothetical protein